MGDADYRAGLFGRGVSRRALLGGFAVVAGSGSMLGACSREQDPRVISDRAALTFLTIVPLTSLTFAPELFADAAGYFVDHGIDVTFELARGSAQAIQLVLAGRAPLTRISQIDGMRAAANRNAPILNVSTVFKGSTIRYVSSSTDPLLEPGDFVGKVIGIPSKGGSSELELDLFLAASGIDRRSVQRQVVGLAPGVFNLVQQRRIAGYAVSIDTAKVLEGQQKEAMVLNPGNYMRSGGQFYMASQAGFEQNHEAISRFVAAVGDSLEFMLADENFEQTLAILRSKYSFDSLNDTAIAKESLREYADVWTASGRENLLLTLPERWTEGYKELVAAGLAERDATPEQWFTNELVGRL